MGDVFILIPVVEKESKYDMLLAGYSLNFFLFLFYLFLKAG